MKPPAKGRSIAILGIAGCGAVCLCLVAAVSGAGFLSRFVGVPEPAARKGTLPAAPAYTVLPTAAPTKESSGTAPEGIGSDGIGDPYFPQMGNGGYDVQHYDVDVNVDMNVEEIRAAVRIDARSLQRLSRFNLDFKGLTITSLKVNGTEAEFSREEGELVVTPSAEIPSGTEFVVDVEYAGRPTEDEPQEGMEFLEGWNFYPEGVIVAGEPAGAETWYPSNNHPLDKATFAFRVTVAKPFVAAANGVLHARTDNGDGTWTYVWAMDDPMATYLATIAISNFEVRERTSKTGIAVRDYLDADIRRKVEDSTAVLPDALDFFSTIFGPYPFDACGVVVHELALPFSLENQTLIVMGYTFAFETVVVHELAHQWFGDSVSVASWKDIWLNEGFASYAEALWWEHTLGYGALEQDLTERYEYLAGMSGSRIDPIGDPGPDHLFDPEVYDRGALTMHALRLKVGDTAFFRILKEYFQKFKNRNASTADFIDLAEEISGQELDEFFNIWLYETALPDIPEMELYHE
jgi:aminopeptidase N